MALEQQPTHPFAMTERACIVLPAGCGKTELLATALGHLNGHQLILTHTHAGVRAIRQRLDKLGVPLARCRVCTIAAWALEYASLHPTISHYCPDDFATGRWEKIYRGATAVLRRPIGKVVVLNSHEGVLVDEYQDCTVAQHELVSALAEHLPCRIVGDPLQSVFGFRNEQLPDWNTVSRFFSEIVHEPVPWRWRSSNRPLGQWLLSIREPLARGDSIEIPSTVSRVRWSEHTPQNVSFECCRALNGSGESVVVIGNIAKICHTIARNVGRCFTSLDERERKDLSSLVADLEENSPVNRVLRMGRLAKECMTKLPASLIHDYDALLRGKSLPRMRGTDPSRDSLRAAIDTPSIPTLLALYHSLEKSGKHIYRKDLWFDAGRVLRIWEQNVADGPIAASRLLLRTRIHSEPPMARYLVARTLLVKGLEFDHVIVVGADEMDPENLYVALTRARKSVTVLSKSTVLTPKPSRRAAPRQLSLDI